MSKYLYEITHDFNGPIGGIVKYLKVHAKSGDIVAMTYGDLPVKFYTDLFVVGGLTGQDLSPAKNAKWIIIRKRVHCDVDMAVRKYINMNVPGSKYQPIRLDSPDTPFENREDPQEHLYKTVTNEDRVIIFERIKP